MKRLVALITLCLALPAFPQAPPTHVLIRLAQTLDAKNAKPGDVVAAKLMSPLRDASGAVLVPKGGRIFAKLTLVTPPAKDGDASIGLVFDHAETKDGKTVALEGFIQAVAAPVQNDDDPSATMMHSATSGRAGDAAVAANQAASVATGVIVSTGDNAADADLDTSSFGVRGIQDVSFNSDLSNQTHSSVLTAVHRNLKLAKETRMALQVTVKDAAKLAK